MKKLKIGKRIRSIRAGKGYTRAHLADELNITPGTFAKIERGESGISASRLMQIADILEVSVTDFFDDAVESFQRK